MFDCNVDVSSVTKLNVEFYDISSVDFNKAKQRRPARASRTCVSRCGQSQIEKDVETLRTV